MKNTIVDHVNELKEDFLGISQYIYEHPELGDEEYQSSQKLMEFLNDHGFQVVKGIVGRETAFKAIFDSGKPGPNVAFLCEYDALPGIGHGCGHNLIGTMSMGAGVALSKVLEHTGGKITVLGTPAEETNGAKVPMAEQGIFADIDAALMVHPSGESYESGESLAMDALQFEFFGRTSHAAASPHEGINALDGVLQLFNGINALRQHVKQDVRIHGIIKDGGTAANVVPEYARAQFYIRSMDRQYLNEVVEKVKNIAQGAATMTGAELKISNYELSYDDMKTNHALSSAFTHNMKLAGVNEVLPAKDSYGSIDMGNVSQVTPAIHPYIGLGKPDLIAHTRDFAELTVSDAGKITLLQGIQALAFTGYDVLTDKDLLAEMKREFHQIVKGLK
ncbi:M20 family metallopeptidase [Peribacillus alkalitolerans]|uniref:M20 family metallopeptidase n=1 Tax=Peribacillus alkalitolerans TaxID=1550385 RepID=UPI0013D1D2F4|nr:M20 family metallopeptidase [Peribacillus alkalitolerans]